MGGGGGPRFRILGGPRGAKFPEAHDVVMTSMRRNDVASTSFRRHVPNRFLINQCQIITFLILKYDIIENSRIELRRIVLPVQVGGLLGGGGGPKGMLAPPLKLLGGLAPPGPPSSYAYVIFVKWKPKRNGCSVKPSVQINIRPISLGIILDRFI